MDGLRRPVFAVFSRPHSEGAGAVACAAAVPLAVLALAVAADYAKVSHFREPGSTRGRRGFRRRR